MSVIVKSGVPGKVPTSNQLTYGQLALNYADQKIYFKNSSNVVVQLSTTPSFTIDPITKPSTGINSPSARFSLTTANTLDLNITAQTGGTSATNTYQSGIGYKVGGNTLAGIVFSNNNTDGTAIAFYCTNSYASGPQLRAYILPTGDFVAAGNVTAYSDIRLKTELLQISNAIDKVKSLTGYTYTRRDTGKRQTGLIAQDVQAVLPEAVEDDGERLSLAYGNLVGLLVEAIKELEIRVQVIERRLDAS